MDMHAASQGRFGEVFGVKTKKRHLKLTASKIQVLFAKLKIGGKRALPCLFRMVQCFKYAINTTKAPQERKKNGENNASVFFLNASVGYLQDDSKNPVMKKKRVKKTPVAFKIPVHVDLPTK